MRVRFLPLILLLLAAGAPAQASGGMLVQTAEGQSLLDTGRTQMIDFRLVEAERTFYRLAQLEPGGPAPLFHLSQISLWHALLREEPAYWSRFFERSDSLLAVIGAQAEGPWKTHMRAEAELHRGIALAKQQSYVRAALALRRAYLEYDRNVRSHPDFFESYKGMGLCQIAVGSIPSGYRTVLNVLGFSGTVDQGLRNLEIAATRSRYNREESSIMLGMMDQLMNESRGGQLVRLEALHRQHRQSPLMGYLYGIALLGQRQAEDAERVLRAASRQQREIEIPFVDYYLGDALFRLGRLDEADRHFKRFVNRFDGKALLPQAHLKIGLGLELRGRRSEAVAAYRQVQSRDDFDSDQAAKRLAERRLRNPLTPREHTLMLGQLAYDSGRYDEAIRLLQAPLTDGSAAEIERAEAAYRSARAFHAQGRYAEALRHYQIAVSRPGDRLAKWGPWSQFHMGEILAEQGERDGARRAFRAVLDNRDKFEYHKSLETRAKTAMSRLG
jgi:tetratricopeptide (TPR) repeat protein